MKRIFILVVTVMIASAIYAQECVNCNDNTVSAENFSSAIGSGNVSTGLNSFAGGTNSSATGEFSFAFGSNAIANGKSSIAFGKDVTADGMYSYSIGRGSYVTSGGMSLGNYNYALPESVFMFGRFLKSTAGGNMVIGMGAGLEENYLLNNIPSSLMIGFRSKYPTLFVVGESGSNNDETGKVGIGNITDPQAKLHILGDDDFARPDDASLFIESSNESKFSTLWIGDKEHKIYTRPNADMTFELNESDDFYFKKGNIKLESTYDLMIREVKAINAQGLSVGNQYGNGLYISNIGNVGIGTEDPKAKLQISDGDIYLEDINSGIIMKSPDGQCWRGTMNNSGNLQFETVDCSTITSIQNEDFENNLNIQIYPNPANDILKIELEGNTKSLNVRLSDMNGRLIFTEKLNGKQLKINTKSLPTGDYIIEVMERNGKRIYSSKVVVL